jgi:hypothetical protein
LKNGNIYWLLDEIFFPLFTGKMMDLIQLRYSDREECVSESNACNKIKKVNFFESDADKNYTLESGNTCYKSNTKHREFDTLNIDRGEIPNGSTLFQQILKEIKLESENEVQITRTDICSKPLKSILKHKS